MYNFSDVPYTAGGLAWSGLDCGHCEAKGQYFKSKPNSTTLSQCFLKPNLAFGTLHRIKFSSPTKLRILIVADRPKFFGKLIQRTGEQVIGYNNNKINLILSYLVAGPSSQEVLLAGVVSFILNSMYTFVYNRTHSSK